MTGRVLCIAFSGDALVTHEKIHELEEAGYECVELGHEAVPILHTAGFDLVIQFGLSSVAARGFEFLAKLRELMPEVPILVVSGHYADNVAPQLQAFGASYFDRIHESGGFVRRVEELLKSVPAA